MIRDDLRHHRPSDTAEAAQLLAEHGDRAGVLGGGTVLVPALTRAERRLQHVVDLRGLGLDGLEPDGDTLHVGAMVTYGTLLRGPAAGDVTDLLREAAGVVTGGCQIRNQGTVGGSACYANPSSDVPGVLVALQAELVVIGVDGSRVVPAAEFFLDAFTTALRPGEFLASIRIRRRPGSSAYAKIKSGSSGWPVVGVSAVADRDAGTVHLGITAQHVPVGLDVTDVADSGQDLVDAVREVVVNPWEDEQASARYRHHVAGILARRAVEGLDR